MLERKIDTRIHESGPRYVEGWIFDNITTDTNTLCQAVAQQLPLIQHYSLIQVPAGISRAEYLEDLLVQHQISAITEELKPGSKATEDAMFALS